MPTITEKILAAHCNKKSVQPGELIEANLDFAFGNDITAPIAIKEFEELSMPVFDKSRIGLIPDHFTPAKDIKSAQQVKILKDFAKKHNIINFFSQGEVGIEHVLLPDMGLVLPGDVVIGADSHTCTYGAIGAFSTGVGSTDLAAAMATGKTWFKVPESIKFNYEGKMRKWVSGKDLILYTIGEIGVDGALYSSMEFTGEIIKTLPQSDRFTMCNMAIEAGAKNGIIEPDKITEAYVKGRAKRKYSFFKSDKDAHYKEAITFNGKDIEPQVAFPFLPDNTKPVSEVGNIDIDQVVIGSCTNGRIEDLEIAAKILKGRKVAKGLRMIVIPGTQEIYLDAIKKGFVEIFIKSGGIVSTPTCGPCLGGHMGILADDESCVSTTNRNFVGRMGHVRSKVYLASPAVAAASAIKGKITNPEDIK